MCTTDRYIKIITAKLKMLQAKHDHDAALEELNRFLMVAECDENKAKFKCREVNQALKFLSKNGTIKIKPCKHFQAQLAFKDVSIFLNSDPDNLNKNAMFAIMFEGS
jgi:hypothetical protein